MRTEKKNTFYKWSIETPGSREAYLGDPVPVFFMETLGLWRRHSTATDTPILHFDALTFRGRETPQLLSILSSRIFVDEF